jgi:hypothetical protein
MIARETGVVRVPCLTFTALSTSDVLVALSGLRGSEIERCERKGRESQDGNATLQQESSTGKRCEDVEVLRRRALQAEHRGWGSRVSMRHRYTMMKREGDTSPTSALSRNTARLSRSPLPPERTQYSTVRVRSRRHPHHPHPAREKGSIEAGTDSMGSSCLPKTSKPLPPV